MKQNRTRTALADAYMRLLNDYTIDRITVKMITDAVGCSRKTFYYYFTDIYVLTQYVFELRVQHFLDTNGNFETVREGFLTLAANLSNDRQAILNIYHIADTILYNFNLGIKRFTDETLHALHALLQADLGVTALVNAADGNAILSQDFLQLVQNDRLETVNA